MHKVPRHSTPSSPVSVHVEVKGSLDVPLNFGLLSDLGDPMLEQEIVKEAVRIAVIERLGYFDSIDVRLSPSGGRERGPQSRPNGQQQLAPPPMATRRGDAPPHYCEADIDLQRLGVCIEAIQKAYEDLLAQAYLVQEVLCGAELFAGAGQRACNADTEQEQQQLQSAASASPNSIRRFSSDAPNEAGGRPSLDNSSGSGSGSAFPDPNNNIDTSTADPASARYADATHRLSAARRIVEQMLCGRRRDVVSEAAVLHDSEQLRQETNMLAQERARSHKDGNTDSGNTTGVGRHGVSHVDHEDGVDAELRRGLLAEDEEEDVSQRGQETSNEDEHDDDDDLDEEALHERYLRAGYTLL
ncbi:hypothetical protein ABB37_06429 [Leptomonas pyrrhocoris]|uniref:Uncharacterized protein n=1 Tax=Leptomonas pyrrhocoris TaxID=157538 RepID=A0A0N0DU17_LEPPY|nr:hypothetical protein ABB37_06429 [Leptomonas pyrrhocoris]XP_015656726.1 hypothetical protein ABB37_06429 [Leptomonas pyrrhocoris]XP_015656727.1 hypothetical protein ABB37_06429 [Leptomonas pyrrhocoris]KPA78286.1 hypothetical protein ABB37_06429 [Leptomonas pyrrhocoris]KPA78287.1 hypothetical protein ABB37_06429 [Leptomonas pyrrhocoris]KPA78288.1 hypothetical protein ABB37_06429 [Leptomonas pyrrhocoris]|eukprot:XP_015656725.1 hypothetical protein ABB37_06429 [Leptomonas pyrrhocoris]